MRQQLNARADFKLDFDFRAHLESFQCTLVGCLAKNSCHSSSTCLSPDRDLKLPGNFTIHYPTGQRQEFLMKDVDQARQKMALCGLEVIQSILAPRLEHCVKCKLNLGPNWKLPIVTADQLAKNLSAVILAQNTVYQEESALREIARQMNAEAGKFCPSTGCRHAAQTCISNALEAAEKKISHPWHSPYGNAQDAVHNFCRAREICTKSCMNNRCVNAYLQIPAAINTCYDWSEGANESDILAPYLNCLARQQGFPPFSAASDIVLFKTNTLRKLTNLMTEDLQVRTGKFRGNLTEFATAATDECNPTFALTSNEDQLEDKFNIVEVEKDEAYLLLPKNDAELRRRRKRQADKQGVCTQYNALKAQMDNQCSGGNDKPISSAAPISTTTKRQIETLLAAGESAFEEGVVGPTIIVKQNVFALNHPFLKYQELLNMNTPPYRRLTKFGHG
uniref:Uncharacterized protein n=1 Tax=Plectus sambesii TaxID=2011161 RepID=A0A914XCP2_9BILA